MELIEWLYSLWQCYLHMVGPLTLSLLQIYCWVRFGIIFEIAQHLAKLWGKVDCLKCTVLLKDEELAWDLMYGGQDCCNRISLRLILLTNLDSVMDKCQTGVMPTTCYSPTHAISDWTLMCVHAFCRDVFLLVSWMCVQSVILRVFPRGHSKYFH